MVEERIQALLTSISEKCPNIGPVPCFMDDKRAILRIHFRYDSDPIPEKHEDDEDYHDPMDHGYNHMFIHVLDLEESDWSEHEKAIIDRYNKCMQNTSDQTETCQ